MLHPEILDCLENHTMRVSKFALEKKTSVIAHITIRSWSLEKKSGKRQEKQQKSQQPDPRGQDILEWNAPRFLNDEELIRLPQELDKIYRVDKQTGDLKRDPPNMELKVSSIGMSTNEFGDFSKFTVITDLIPPRELKKLSRTVHDIWNKFVHQPQTGRFLVFSAILACICQEIAAHYHDAVRVFVGEFQLDSISNSYLTDSRWLQSTEAESRLQLSLWSLEALHKLNNTMEFTVRTIELAKGEIEEEIRKGPGKRSEELEEMCIMYQEPLRRSLAELTAAQIKLERKVELNSRYSDRLSTLLALRDSRAAFSQNNTIQKLTYITIGCLPIALTAALFAVPDDQHVIAPRMGRNWFIYLILIFFFAILATARLLDSIISAFRVLDEVDLKLALRRTGLWIGYCLDWVYSRCNSVLKQLQDRYHQLKSGKEDHSSIQGQDPELGDLVLSSTQDSSKKQ
ncbi:hypothetical protein B0I35DRAFT_446717 [Stachybotrys elegans]|uniref:Uncharacterized protein n=1 Tax=Stachybotrys elegans TaxID=80388 RepID=A0A8K0WJW9_9HYPO|nr:hypothetical protein B0I35DRAFT_446717 [Stachybotrys elegans]